MMATLGTIIGIVLCLLGAALCGAILASGAVSGPEPGRFYAVGAMGILLGAALILWMG